MATGVLRIPEVRKPAQNRPMFDAERETFRKEGYAIARGLFAPEETRALIDHFMAVHADAGGGWADRPIEPESPDPLRRYPRLCQMHRGDAPSLGFMLDERIRARLVALLGAEPYAVQTMMYFKPAGARGQALHQDQRYLRVQPGTCVAAWLALDDCDAENGCLQVVPGTHEMDLLCPIVSDRSKSFTRETVPVPPGHEVRDLPMRSGDVVFFNGQLIHGSGPNESKDRFRRIVVGHYVVGEAEAVARHYHPVLRFDGTEIPLGVSEGGGACGEFREKGFQIVSTVEEALAAH